MYYYTTSFYVEVVDTLEKYVRAKVAVLREEERKLVPCVHAWRSSLGDNQYLGKVNLCVPSVLSFSLSTDSSGYLKVFLSTFPTHTRIPVGN